MKWPVEYDVIVVGAGHAGIEAALASARLGAATMLFTFDLDAVGKMSCNPAIGGVAKGHLVREVDALGGEMGRAIDHTGIQFKRLNMSKGPAVWASRAQADRLAYSRYMKNTVTTAPMLDVRQEEIVSLITQKGIVLGVKGRTGTKYYAKAVVVCTGTFLNGLIHIGMEKYPAGRAGDPPSLLFAESLKESGLPMRRLKTGTPPRLFGPTIDWEKLAPQHGDREPAPFSVDTEKITREQVPCFITYTNPRTHELILCSLDRSPLYSGVIKGIGPRYCPSIEDKVKRFSERERHQIFLEPESLESNEIYPNGISTSLPLDVQQEIVNSIAGLEKAKIARPGYAVEYDSSDPTALYPSLESKVVEGLFLSGQINGTSGYEEAAAQGLLAGTNAARRSSGKKAVIIARHEGYMGVMVDDLTTKGASEPYRMFTSRAEYRLILREDNAEMRLAPIAEDCGLITESRLAAHRERKKQARFFREFLEKTSLKPDSKVNALFEASGTPPIKESQRISELLKRPEITVEMLKGVVENWPGTDARISAHVEIEIKYEGYIRRERESVERFGKMDGLRLPEEMNYDDVEGLTNEVREVLKRGRPMTFGQAGRMEGMSPAASAVLLVHLRKNGWA